jgi:hypothetical protein
VGLASKMKAAFDKHNLYPKYYEEWTVTDKNGAKWEIYREAYNSGNKPIMTRTSSAVAGGRETHHDELAGSSGGCGSNDHHPLSANR